MRRLQAIALVIPLVAVLWALVPLIAQGQTPLPRPAGNTTQRGEVRDVNPLTVKVNGQDQLLRTVPDVVVNREGKEVKLGELNKGDTITFTTNPDDSVARIDVTDAATDANTWVWIALLILAVLVIAGVVWYLSQRRKRDGVVPRTDRDTTLS